MIKKKWQLGTHGLTDAAALSIGTRFPAVLEIASRGKCPVSPFDIRSHCTRY
jgi:hypothetical protein